MSDRGRQRALGHLSSEQHPATRRHLALLLVVVKKAVAHKSKELGVGGEGQWRVLWLAARAALSPDQETHTPLVPY